MNNYHRTKQFIELYSRLNIIQKGLIILQVVMMMDNKLERFAYCALIVVLVAGLLLLASVHWVYALAVGTLLGAIAYERFRSY